MQQQQFLPVGCKFQPEDIELLAFYLSNRVANGPSTNPLFIYECDLYGEDKPSEVWDRFRPRYEQLFPLGTVRGDTDLYFFTKLKKKGPEHRRFERHVGRSEGTWLGTWLGNCTGRKVLGLDGRLVIGVVKTFTYKNNKNEENGNWIMHEYSLCEDNPENVVLCRLRKKFNASAFVKDKRSTCSINQHNKIVADSNEVGGPVHHNIDTDRIKTMVSELVNEIDNSNLIPPTTTYVPVLNHLGGN